MKIFTKYITKRYSTNILLSLMLFSFILMMDKIFQLVTLIITKGVGTATVFTLVLYSLPTIFALAMPMSVVAAGIMTCSKMAGDSEVTAIRTSGSTLFPVIMPILSATLILTVLMFPFNYYIAPQSQYEFRKKFMQLAFKSPALRLEANTLIEIKPYTLFAYKVNRKNKTLGEIMIHKDAGENEPAVSINARKGNWASDISGNVFLTLTNGSIKYLTEEGQDKLSNMQFDKYELKIKFPDNLVKVSKNIASMTGTELSEEIRRLKAKNLNTHKLATRYHLRGALAGASMVLILIGIPLGLRAENKGKSAGIAISLGAIAVYYLMMVGGIKMAFNEYINPFLGVWLPNIIAGGTGLYMLYKSNYR
ncbi:MAG: LptF/LptG family permease [Elusimicrobia bacterium]|jgi:lipopolysaccharide export system permease protein|nr:LptF/LptG family permease [Elusimicrobiota bacterium]